MWKKRHSLNAVESKPQSGFKDTPWAFNGAFALFYGETVAFKW
jgi:hypothetical protein